MDMIPVDWLPAAAGAAGIPYLRACRRRTSARRFGLSLAVFLLAFYFGIKHKGVGGFLHEMVTAPFHAKLSQHAQLDCLLLLRRRQPAAASDRRRRPHLSLACVCSATCTPAS